MKDTPFFVRASRLARIEHAYLVFFIFTTSLAASGSETAHGNVGVLTKYPPVIQGHLQGVAQFTTGNTFVLSHFGKIEGPLLVPGSPLIRRNWGCSDFDVIEGIGSASPSNYKLIFNRGSSVDTVVTRVDPVSFSSPVQPNPPLGGRTVKLGRHSNPQDIGNFDTLKNLKLKQNAGHYEIPAGAYGSFSVAYGSGIVLGNAGGTEPAVYHFQKLRFSWGSELQIVGPVVINVAEGFASGGILGNAALPELLTMNIQWGGLNITSGGCFYGNLKTPQGHVHVHYGSILVGSLEARKLHIHRNGYVMGSLGVNPENDENDAPVAESQVVVTDEDVSVQVALSATDADGDLLSYAIVDPPVKGVLVGIAPDLEYIPNENETGPDIFTFVANDGTTDSEIALVNLTINPVNDAPVALDQTVETLEDISVGIQLEANDVEGDPLTFEIVTGPTAGSIAGTLPEVIYTPSANLNGTDEIAYRAFDGELYSETKEYRFVIAPVNDPPVIASAIYQMLENTVLVEQLTVVDVDSSSVALSIVSGPAHGLVSLNGFEFTYSPEANQTDPVSFDVQANDGFLDSNVATISITINPVNEAPTAQDQAFTTDEDTTLSAQLVAFDNDGDPLAFYLEADASKGTVTLTAEGLFNYVPNTDYSGTDLFQVRVEDPHGSFAIFSVNVTVSSINDAPFVETETLSTPEDTSLSGQLLAEDAEEDALIFALESPPVNGVVSIEANGAFTYTPNADYNGPDLFTFTVSDGGETVSGGIILAVESVNDAPTASGLSLGVAENESLPLTLLGEDVDGDELSFTIVAGPNYGVLKLDGVDVESYPARLLPGNLRYTPNSTSGSADTFTYSVSDGLLESSIETVELLVGPSVNQAPIVEAGNNQTLSARSITDLSHALGVLVVCSDEWYLSNEGYALSPSTGNFARNLLGIFDDEPGAQFLAYCTPHYRGFAESEFMAAVSDEGHSLVVDDSQVMTFEYLSQFDAVFVDASFSPNKEALGEYIDQGGNVYITAASGLMSPEDEADFWNPFLSKYGMSYASEWNGIQTTLPLDPGNPLSKEVTDLYYFNGANITLTDPLDPRLTVIQTFGEDYLLVARSSGLDVESVLEGMVSDDGLPIGSELSTEWSVVEGSGEVVLSDFRDPVSEIGFSTPGSYTLRLQASDGERMSADEVTILVVKNDPPIVYAGPDAFTAGIENPVVVDGFVYDDGFPASTLEMNWSVNSGPSSVVFLDPESATTTAQFGSPGIYVLNLHADDSLESSNDVMEFRVGPLGSAPLPDGLKAWWPFNGTLAEAVLGGSPLKATTVPTYVDGKVSTALEFDGVSEGPCASGSDRLDVGASAKGLTIEFWMNPSAYRDAVLAEWGDGVSRGVSFRQWSFGRGLYGFLRDTDGNEHSVFSNDVLELDAWQHVALTYDRNTGVARIYRNAVLLSEADLGVFTPKSDLDFCLGSSRSEGLFFKGGLDEVALYGRPLSSEEIRSIYVAGDAGKSPVGNHAPEVDAGLNAVLTDSSSPLSLTATVVDEDGPLEVLEISWSKRDGPGTVTFSSADQLSTTAQFSLPGIYLLEVSVHDGLLRSADFLEVRVGVTAIEPHPGLAAWWPLNGNPQEAISGVHNFNLEGGSDYVSGKVSQGLDFDGSSGLAMAEAGPGLDVGASPEGLTVELWVKPSEFRDAPLVEWASGGVSGVSLRQWWFGQGLYGFLKDASGVERIVSVDGVMELGVWQHVGLTYDAQSGLARLYRNGLEVAASNLGVFAPRTDLDFVAGASLAEGRFFKGTLDEVALYRRPLSPLEIRAVFLADSAGRAPVNYKAPIIWAGSDRSLNDLAMSLDLVATVEDDEPLGALEIVWTKRDGPGAVTFTSPNQLSTTAQFESPGVYLLEVFAHDGLLRSADVLEVRVEATGVESPSGLAAWWPLNGDPREALVGVHNFTLEGSSDYVSGRVSLGLGLDGSTGRAVAEAGPGLDVGTSPEGLTVELWVNPSEFKDAPLVEWASGGNSGVSLRQWWFGQGLYGFLKDASGVERIVSVNGVMELGVWQHVALTYDAQSGLARLYRNGLEVAASNVGVFVPRTDLDFVAGASLVEGRYFKGALDEVALYRRALSAVEIQSVYQAGSYGRSPSEVPLNEAPRISAGPDLVLSNLVSSFDLNGLAIDDGLPEDSSLQVEWTQLSGPAATIVSANTLTTRVEGAGPGVYEFVLSVDDSEFVVTDSVRVRIPQVLNLAPSVFAGTDAIAYVNEEYTLPGAVVDDDESSGASLETLWTKVTGTGGAVFVDPTDPATNVIFDRPGVYELRLSASDSEYESSDSLTVAVYNRVNVSLQLPEVDLVYTSNGDVVFQAYAESGGAPVQLVEFFVGGFSVGSASPIPGTITHRLAVPASTLTERNGAFSVYAVAIDGYGQAATSEQRAFFIVDPAAATPFAQITSPEDGTIITAPTAIIGSASSEILDYYELEYRSVESDTWTEFASGSVSVPDGELGVFDSTRLLNGVYEVKITTIDLLGRIASENISIVVDGGLKIGNLSLAFEDLSIPVSGIPMQVIRSYDSRDLRQGDFGVGWQLAASNMRIQKNRPVGESWDHYPTEIELPIKDENGDPLTSVGYKVESTRNNIITIRLPDDSIGIFKAFVEPEITRFVPNRSPEIFYEALGDTLGSLEIVGQKEGWLSVTGNGLNMESEAFAFDVFNPTLYRYTAVDGTKYLIDEELGLISVSDRNGNALTIAESGISHSSGDSITFVRDAEGRVTQIVDPLGETLDYSYDLEGRLETFSNQEDETFTFLYENADFPYYLTDILDPNNESVLSSSFDNDGRLAAQTDANGNSFGFVHDIENFQETVIDRLDVKTVHTYNLDGDVVRTEVFDTTDTLVQTTAYEYDERGNETKVIDSLGNLTERSYDDQDNLLSETKIVTNELGVATPATTSYTYDDFGSPLSLTDALGNETRFNYDINGNLESQTDALENVTTFNYDETGNLIQIADPLGNVTQFTHTARGLPETTSVYDSGGFLVRYQFTEYDAKGRQTKVQDYDIPEGASDASGVALYRSTEFDYDAADRQTATRVRDATDNILTSTSTTYDSRGQVETQTDASGRVTTFEYDPNGNRTKSTLHNSSFIILTSESWSYDAEGRQSSHSDPAGRVTEFDHDALGRQISFRFIGTVDEGGNDLDSSDNTQTDTIYDEIGRVTATVDERDNVTLFEYDDECGCSGRRSKTIDALLNETTFRYDLNGNQIAVIDAEGHETTFEYDPLNRPTKTIFHDDTFTETIYDALGRKIATIDPGGNRTDYVYDALGRLVEVVQPILSLSNGLVRPATQYKYDSRGNQTEQTDAEGRTTTFEYDVLGRRIKRILPEGQEETYQYDVVGNLIAKVDFAGYTTTFEYDEMNRLIKETADPTHPSLVLSHAPSTVEHQYDIQGNRIHSSLFTIHSSPALRSETYTYDERNRLATKTGPEGTLQYSYDAAGNLSASSSSNANGVDVTYGYDALNRLSTVNDNRQPFALSLTNYEYDGAGNLETVDCGNNVRHDYTYDALNRLTNLVVETPNVGVHASYAYTLNDAGNRTTVVESTGRTTEYQYDNLYRLTEEAISSDPSGPTGTVGYAYDRVGNRLSRTSTVSGIPTQNFNYSANDLLTTDTLGVSSVERYDDNGNTAESEDLTDDSGGNATDIYDYRNRLIRRTKADGTIIDLHYDATGNRVRKDLLDSALTIQHSIDFLVDGNNLTGYAQVVEQWENGTLEAVYTYGHDLISQDRLQPDPLQPNNLIFRLSFYLYDGHGTVRQLADAFGTITDTYTYDAFGILLDRSGSTRNAYLYTGEQYDSDLGMYFLRARYLNTQTGRFHTRDTYEGRNSDPLTLHKYHYAHGNAVMNVDPSGMFSIVGLANTIWVRSLVFSLPQFTTSATIGLGIQARTVSIATPLIRELELLASELSYYSVSASMKVQSQVNALRSLISVPSIAKGVLVPAVLASLPPPYNVSGYIWMALNAYSTLGLVYKINSDAYSALEFETEEIFASAEADLHTVASVFKVIVGFRNPSKDIAPASSALMNLRNGKFGIAGEEFKSLGTNLSYYGRAEGEIDVNGFGRDGNIRVSGSNGAVNFSATGVFSRP